MFVANTPALLHRKTGRDEFGIQTFNAPEPIRVGVVDLADLVTPSAVRADHSASRGSAFIDTLTATLLLPKKTIVQDGDVIVVDDFRIEVTGVMPRRNVLGQLDHWQVTGSMWPGEL